MVVCQQINISTVFCCCWKFWNFWQFITILIFFSSIFYFWQFWQFFTLVSQCFPMLTNLTIFTGFVQLFCVFVMIFHDSQLFNKVCYCWILARIFKNGTYTLLNLIISKLVCQIIALFRWYKHDWANCEAKEFPDITKFQFLSQFPVGFF